MIIAGVDEAGRGPLAGPVVSAAVILDPKKRIRGLKDSKLLTPKQRDSLFLQICKKAISFGVGQASVEEINRLNILQATFLSMRRAVAALKWRPDKVIVDGNQDPKLDIDTETIIAGDLIKPPISAASIVAKVTRDRIMIRLEERFPGYGFAKHKGYGTKFHLSALKEKGPCIIHRKDFKPIKMLYEDPYSFETFNFDLEFEESNV